MDLTFISNLLTHYGYFLILPIAILEGPIITVMAAFFASQGLFNIYLVYLIVVLGDLLGDLLFYLVGRIGKKQFLLKWGHYFGATEERITGMVDFYKNNSAKTLLFGKFTHSLGWLVLAGAGVAEMPIGRFLWINLVGTLPKSLAFLLIGYYVGYAYKSIDLLIGKISIIIFAVIASGAVLYIYKKYNSL